MEYKDLLTEENRENADELGVPYEFYCVFIEEARKHTRRLCRIVESDNAYHSKYSHTVHIMPNCPHGMRIEQDNTVGGIPRDWIPCNVCWRMLEAIECDIV